MTAVAEEALEAQRRVRNSSQHVYVELSVSNVREAVKRQLDTTPAVVRSIIAWVDSLDKDGADPGAGS